MSSQFSINAVAGKVKYWELGYWGFKSISQSMRVCRALKGHAHRYRLA
jgi:hypothetical protein